MITTLIFDLWNTLGKKNASFSATLEKHFEIDLHKDYTSFEKAIQLKKWSTKEEMAKAFLKEYKLEQTEKNIHFVVVAQEDVLHFSTPFERIRQILERYKEHLHIALLTNTTCFEGEVIENWGFEELFDAQFFSFETGLLKPHQEAFVNVMNKLDVLPRECIFIDDSQKNCAMAKKLGMQTIHFENVAQMEEELKALIRAESYPK